MGDQLKLDLGPSRRAAQPPETERSSPLVDLDDDDFEECCGLCNLDPPESTEREFRRELVGFLRRRAFYHTLDVANVANALDKLAWELRLAACHYKEDPTRVSAIDLWSYLNPPEDDSYLSFTKDTGKDGVLLYVIMYYDALTSNVALLDEAIKLQGGGDVWLAKVFRGRPNISKIEYWQAESESIARLRANHPERARQIEQGEVD